MKKYWLCVVVVAFVGCAQSPSVGLDDLKWSMDNYKWMSDHALLRGDAIMKIQKTIIDMTGEQGHSSEFRELAMAIMEITCELSESEDSLGEAPTKELRD